MREGEGEIERWPTILTTEKIEHAQIKRGLGLSSVSQSVCNVKMAREDPTTEKIGHAEINRGRALAGGAWDAKPPIFEDVPEAFKRWRAMGIK
ncbi:hypothetical protein ACLOJK_007104 [Asimina triloba]